MNRLLATAQDARIAGFQTKHRRIGRHIRTRFVNNPDHPDRHSDLGDCYPVRTRPLANDFPARIRQGRHLAHAFRHGTDACGIQLETIHRRRIETVARRRREIPAVGGEDILPGSLQGIGHGHERRIFLILRRQRQHPRRGTRLFTEFFNLLPQVRHSLAISASPRRGSKLN